eukprot:evm.model.NODE_47661_length_12524_cov_19.198978.2
MHVPICPAAKWARVPNIYDVAHHGYVVAHVPGSTAKGEEDRGPQDPDVPWLLSRCKGAEFPHHHWWVGLGAVPRQGAEMGVQLLELDWCSLTAGASCVGQVASAWGGRGLAVASGVSSAWVGRL